MGERRGEGAGLRFIAVARALSGLYSDGRGAGQGFMAVMSGALIGALWRGGAQKTAR